MTRSDSDFFDLKDILAMLRRKIRLIFLSIVVVMAIAFSYLFYATPLYTATALLLVDTSQKNLLDPDSNAALKSSADNARLESEVEILKSDTIKLATIEKAGLLSDPEFGPRLSTKERIKTALGFTSSGATDGNALVSQALARLSGATEIRRRGLTYLISVSVSSNNPERAATIANAMSETYIEQQIQSKVANALAARDLLAQQVEVARGTLAQSEEALDGYIDNNIDRLSAESDTDESRALRAELLAANASLLNAKVFAQDAQTALDKQDWKALASSLGDAALAQLARERDTLQRQLGDASAGSQLQIDLQTRLAEIDKGIENTAQTSLKSLQQNVASLESSARDQRAQFRRSVLSGDLSSETLAQIYEMQQEADIAQRQYSTLLTRARDLQAQAVVQVADSRIVSEAMPPRNTSFPNSPMVLAVALLLALTIGVVLALISEFYLGGVTSLHQLGHVLPTPVATSIPLVDPNKAQLTVADNIVDAPLSVYSEALRRLRASIDMSLRNSATDTPVIMVTSAIPAEGKSSLALALARTYALAGKSTLLLDADLRKPTLHKYLGLSPERGFVEYLQGDEIVSQDGSFYDSDPRSPLGAVLGRQRSDQPTDQLLQSSIFETLIENARNAMDVVIIDTSPLIPVVDARYVAQYADVVVNSVRFGVTTQSDLRLAYEQLSHSVAPGTPILSVLNHDDSKVSDYRYTGYYNDYNRD